MIQRLLEDRIHARLKTNKAILVFGARRVGKTMLIKHILQQFRGKSLLLNGEDYDTLSLLEPRSVTNYRRWLQDVKLLAIDEAQSIPDIGLKLKLMIDEFSGLTILASGSSSFDLLNKAGEPLVGRSYQYYIYPFCQKELSATETPADTLKNLEDRLIYGSYPEVVTMSNYEMKKEYLQGIVHAYLLRDILAVDGIKNASKMRDLLRLIAYQTGKEVSYNELGQQLGLSRNTVEKYLDLLSQVFIIYKLSAYSRNLRKEISKAAKWYFYDPGIRNAVIGNFDSLTFRQDVGALWECYLIGERIKMNQYFGQGKEFYFWRTYDGQEIDLLEITSGRVSAYEFKWGSKHAKTPGAFASAYPDAPFAVINRDNYSDFISE